MSGKEWLEADGLGGFAMGTADGVRTRRYHALLLAATRPPDARMVLVADVEAYVTTAAGRFAITSHAYAGVVHPDGRERIASFAWQPWPRWEWALPDGTRIAGEIVVARGAPRVALRWTRIAGTGRCELWVRPLLAGRDYHGIHRENGAFRFDADVRGEVVTWRPYDGVPAVRCASNGTYAHAPDWYRRFVYAEEQARGLDCEEDLATPGTFTFDLAHAPARMAFGTDELDGGFVEDAFARERTRRAAFATPLARAADDYIVARGGGHTIIAGYPWFSDWGRDTFISLRGLCLATGRRDVARSILLEWTRAIDGGMLPNRFGEREAVPEYNSVDAALWFVIAADAYGIAVEPALADAVEAIVGGYARGTRHRIGATEDGLLACGEPGLQLTWMDAKVGGDVITPRIGKPVEIQALWLNALAIAGRHQPRWREMFERGAAAFRERFWNADAGTLFDVVDVDHVAGAVDPTLRPNQLFAIGGLPLQLVEGERARAVVDACERALWTPAGPRSVGATDARYRGRYAGAPHERDRCYHNGPVWPWLAGAFVDAWLRVRGNTPAARAEARQRFVAPLHARLAIAGLGHLSEIADGDPPFTPGGCPFQAWSVAELLRLDASLDEA